MAFETIVHQGSGSMVFLCPVVIAPPGGDRCFMVLFSCSNGVNRNIGGNTSININHIPIYLFAIPILSNVFKSQLICTLSLVNFLNKIANIFEEQKPSAFLLQL